MKKTHHRYVASLCAAAMFSLGCGTILHPERRGVRGGRVDAGIAVMDALWCLLFIIPGVVAFVVDFNTGAIYLPGSGADAGTVKVVHAGPNPDIATIEAVVKRETGKRVRITDPNTVTHELASADQAEGAVKAY